MALYQQAQRWIRQMMLQSVSQLGEKFEPMQCLSQLFCKTHIAIQTHAKEFSALFRCFFTLWGNMEVYTYGDYTNKEVNIAKENMKERIKGRKKREKEREKERKGGERGRAKKLVRKRNRVRQTNLTHSVKI